VTDTAKAAEAALDEQFFATTDKACKLQQVVKVADPNDPVHAELRRTMERLSDIERELRMRDRFRVVQGLGAPSPLVV
jgi:hypothetical protein